MPETTWREPLSEPQAGRTARVWLEAGAPHVRFVLHFGSTRSGASPGRRSVPDLLLAVDDYEGFYRAARPRLGTRRSPRFLARANRILPPNVLHAAGAGSEAKLFVISTADLEGAVGPHPKDHFVRGRLCQDVEVIAWAEEEERLRGASVLAEARRRVPDWMRPFLRGPFDALGLARRMLEVSYRFEIRPESAGRSREVFEAQREFFAREYGLVLEAAAADGRLARRGDLYETARPAGALERASARWWFAGSRLRATLRWAKYVMTFEGWLDYIVAKAERRTGLAIPLEPRERRWPFVFLWPKFFRVLRARNREGAPR